VRSQFHGAVLHLPELPDAQFQLIQPRVEFMLPVLGLHPLQIGQQAVFLQLLVQRGGEDAVSGRAAPA